MIDISFLLTQALSLTFLFIVQFSTGLLVLRHRVKVNYTRKINHFLLFVVPILLNREYAVDQTVGLFVLGSSLAVLKFAFYVKPIRDRVFVIRTMFSSFDRPEDRPNTLLWLVTQTAAGYAVLLTTGLLLSQFGHMELILIPLLIYGIGDGLAEPIGVRFGRHKYNVPSLFSNKDYYRTLEGSACVFVTSVLVVAAHYGHFSPLQLGVALGVVPVSMTLAEALSPHTWDSPLMFLVGGLAMWGIMLL